MELPLWRRIEILIDTRSLDGETKFTPKTCHPIFKGVSRTELEGMIADMKILVQPPNSNLHKFRALVTYKGTNYPMDSVVFIPRNAIVKNTSVFGLAVYTGYPPIPIYQMLLVSQ